MRKLVRLSVAASAAALLLLTGCGGDSDSSGGGTGKHKGGSHGSDSDGDGGTGGSGSGGASSAPGSADGAWHATVEGTSLFLTITGNQAATLGKGSCAGTYQAQTLSLKCADGSTDRTSGKAELSGDGDSLTVSWEASGEETFRRVDPGTLPQELPTDLPTELPSDLPTGDVTTQ
ncbi:hypothetical protein [Streptomyces sp. KE1]|uniref:hypothetical protein n=1 Tax=Streptomyces sp. KE1 TaxID=1638939 RepID=UPI00063E6DC9|nr:hypothetical protein [Streptomyces sp. KE1]KLJ03857.1 hypothetical protein WQ59_06120 [Streptomyces sp. KE1]MBZ2408940.1 hypothetical protein [Streptomyces sp. L06]